MLCIYRILLVHSSVNGHLGCYRMLAIMNNVAITVGVHTSLWNPAINSSGYIPSKGGAKSYLNSIFNFLRKQHAVFHWNCIMFPPTMCQGSNFYIVTNTCYFMFFVIVAVLILVRWYHIIVWVCISLVINSVKHLFMHLLEICILSWINVCSGPFPIFELDCSKTIGLLCCWVLRVLYVNILYHI